MKIKCIVDTDDNLTLGKIYTVTRVFNEKLYELYDDKKERVGKFKNKFEVVEDEDE